MNRRTRINYSDEQKAERWDRWQRGESLKSIGRLFDRNSSSIYLGEQLVLAGFDVTEINEDGQVVCVIGFFGPMPEM